jgi:hypothetical protein
MTESVGCRGEKRMKLYVRMLSFITILFLCFASIPSSQAQKTRSCYDSPKYQGPVGGPGGRPFNHCPKTPAFPLNGGQVAISADTLLKGINIGHKIDNRTEYADWVGEGGGITYTFDWQENEYLVEVSGSYGRYVNSIRFRTNLGNTSQTYGRPVGTPYRFQAPDGCWIPGLHGRAGKVVDAIGVFYRCPTK